MTTMPLLTEPRLAFWVPGPAQTAGSKSPGFVMRKDHHGNRVPVLNERGNPKLTVREAGSPGARQAKRVWREDVQVAARQAMMEQGVGPWMGDEPLAVTFVFVRKRDASHLTTGRTRGLVKDWARDLWPIKQPDVLKNARAAEDALTHIVYRDDAQITDEHICKVYADQVGLPVTAQGTLISVQHAGVYSGPVVT